jgi:hypothetical protein
MQDKSHNINNGNKSFESVATSNIREQRQQIKIASLKKLGAG